MARALYLHIPFCVRRCRYCDFATAATRHGDGLMARYARSLERLVSQAGELGLLEGLRTAYLGGGTPTMLGAEALSSLIARVSDQEPTHAGLEELTFEANPESLGDDVLAFALEAGATRVSIGVQSFCDRELEGLGRVHTAELAEQRVRAAVASGLRVSVDLMCGIPYQTPASWENSLAQAVSLGVGHASCYPLMIEPGTPMEGMCETGELPWPSDDTEANDMEAAERVLGDAGFARYEVASYARSGERCRHNVAYWTGVEYLGLGVAAASMLGREAYEVLRGAVPLLSKSRADAARLRLTVSSDVREVARAQSLADLRFDVEQLSEREAVAEDLMLAARMTDGLCPELVKRAREIIGTARVDACLERLVGEGLLVAGRRGWLAPTHAGWLLGNELYGPLWDLASAGD